MEEDPRDWREVIHYRRCYFLYWDCGRAYALWFVIVPVLAVAVFTVVYSYIEYQKEIKNQENGT